MMEKGFSTEEQPTNGGPDERIILEDDEGDATATALNTVYTYDDDEPLDFDNSDDAHVALVEAWNDYSENDDDALLWRETSESLRTSSPTVPRLGDEGCC